MQVINVIRNLAPTVYFHCAMAMPSSTDSLNNTKVQRILNRTIPRTRAKRGYQSQISHNQGN